MRIVPLTSFLYLILRVVHSVDRRNRTIAYFRPDSVRTFLVVSTTAVGDTVLSTPAIHALRTRYPSARLIALLHPIAGRLLDSHPDIDQFVYYSGRYKDFIQTLMRLRALHPDVAVVLHGNDPQITPLLYLSGIPFIFKLPATNRYSFLLSNSNTPPNSPLSEHVIYKRIATARLAGAQSNDPRMSIPINASQRTRMRKVLSKFGISDKTLLIGFQPGASEPHRIWPKDHFVLLGKKLIQKNSDIIILITGSRNERDLCSSIAGEIGSNAKSIAGLFDLSLLPALIERLSLLITGDTGPLHIAIAVGTPTISLFAAADPEKTGPCYDYEKHIIISKPWDSKTQYTIPPMERITVSEVYCSVMDTITD